MCSCIVQICCCCVSSLFRRYFFLQFSVSGCYNAVLMLGWEWGKDHVVSCFYRHKHGWKLYPVVSILQVLKCHMKHEDADGRNVDTTRMKQPFWHKWCATFWKNVTFFFLPDSRNQNDNLVSDRYLCIKLLLPIDLLLQMFLFSFSANHFVTSGELLPHLHKVKAHQNRCL